MLEQHRSLEQSLARLLPLIVTPATQHTMGKLAPHSTALSWDPGAVQLLSTLAGHSAGLQARIAAVLTNGHSVTDIVWLGWGAL